MGNKQYDPRMHSAEHILNQTMVRMFDCGRSSSNHLEKKKSKCDYHFNRELTEAEVQQIENKVNEVIKSDLAIKENFITRTEAGKHFMLGRLPDDAGNTIRIISVGNYDACPCIGQHVNSTEEIGEFKIISTSFDNDVLRIRFRLNDTE
jgi:Ser-tRNA(Ala) deacylase AlaX